jgi:hypothetical protein
MQKGIVAMFAVVALALVGSTPADAGGKPKPPKAAKPSAKPPASAKPASDSAGSASSSGAGEWSLAEKEYWSKLQEELDGSVKAANNRCGSKMVAAFDKESFRGQFNENNGSYGLSSYARSHCEAAASAIDDICMTVNGNEERANMAKSAVQSKVAVVECRWGGKGKQAINLSGKKLTVTIDPDSDSASSLQDKVKSYMKSKL